jgi:hypothetical protein
MHLITGNYGSVCEGMADAGNSNWPQYMVRVAVYGGRIRKGWSDGVLE